MRRREFIVGLGLAAAWPLSARTQQQDMRVIGWLSVISPGAAVYLPKFKEGLAELRYVEGRNLKIKYRWAEGHHDRLPSLAAELAAAGVSVIVSGSNLPTALAAKAATTSIPVVFFIAEDPVRAGLVKSLSRPGGNVTGVTAQSVELTAKQVELMHDLLPGTVSLAIVINPMNNGQEFGQAAEAAAARLGLHIVLLKAAAPTEFAAAFTNIRQRRLSGLVITSDPLFATNHEKIAALADQFKVPTMFGDGNSESGGLMSYGPQLTDMFRQLGEYTGKVLAGASPADLPVQQPTKIPLKINLRTAKALGLEIPAALLVRADEVIE